MNHETNRQPRRYPQGPQDSMRGFTIIELLLSMTFVAALLLGIAMTIIQVGNIYNKGMALRQINQSSRDIADDLERSVAGSNVATLNEDYQSADSMTAGPAAGPGGRLCLGNYSYVWNYAKDLQKEEADPSIINSNKIIHFSKDPLSTKKDIKINLLKIPDSAKVYCQKNATGKFTLQDVTVEDGKVATELLTGGEHSIGIQKLAIVETATNPDTAQKIFALDFTIGTGTIEAMNADQTACLAPDSMSADITYCNVQQFNLVLRAGNRVN